jgi:transcriptional regulator with XRE-family HTH domain
MGNTCAIERESIRCGSCKLVQFVGAIGTCRRCHKSLRDAPEPILRVVAPKAAEPELPWREQFAKNVKRARLKSGMSQRQVGKSMGATRQYMCKVENQKAFPMPTQVMRIGKALGCELDTLFPKMPPLELTDLDHLMGAIRPYIPKLSPYAMGQIELAAADMAKRERAKQPKKTRERAPRAVPKKERNQEPRPVGNVTEISK